MMQPADVRNLRRHGRSVRQFDEAASHYAHALELQPGRSAALLGSARAEAARGRAGAATQSYRQLADNWREADDGVAGLPEVRAKNDSGRPRTSP